MSTAEDSTTAVDLDRLSIDTIRVLSMDGVQKANSGHPGLPMGMAPVGYLLFTKYLHHDPQDPSWPDRDRFVLSAGHGSMLLYSLLHLSGYALSMDDLKSFRQWGSITPGHPERDKVHVTPGVEMTTGPLGQGFANGVGMAMAERFLRDKFGSEVQDHHTFAIVSDGDLQEGIASEAASLAGHLKLGRLVYVYDDNHIQLDGPTRESYSEDVPKRFEAYGWHTLRVDDANDLDELTTAIDAGIAEEERPTLISVRSIIGWPSPNKQGTSKAHGSPLGEDEVRLTKEVMGWDPDQHFQVPDGVYDHFSQVERGGEAHRAWKTRFDSWRGSHAKLAEQWDAAWSSPAKPLRGLAEALPAWNAGDDAIATRSAGQKVMAAFEPFTPTMMGGAADLSESTKTEFPKSHIFDASAPGRNVKFGVREHGMGGAVNGMAGHGGILRPYGSTFGQFSDYMRGAVRLSALMGLEVAWVYTHDSVGLGEDGPTHQPVEHYAALRAIPGLFLYRPADANETAHSWRYVLENQEGPAAFMLSRQNLPILEGTSWEGVSKGGYVLAEADGDAQLVLVGTGSEVWLCVDARERLQAEGVPTRVVSLPCWELFAEQDAGYRESVLPSGVAKLSVEAGVAMGWAKWVDASVSLERFGASAPGETVLEKLGFSVGNVVARAQDLLAGRGVPGRTPADTEPPGTPQG
ncbi:transketolase [Capillimicrobium parvum]|uniref:Transketolase n=1 Tax=Capillimicrobium parvum TaxID=2884022 RepID=A0A9E7BYS6_9ACTN|nr:transketolase [Capillimicrobium parvum]UGS33794.1 Transketolase [Capillimicrobium parvum]